MIGYQDGFSLRVRNRVSPSNVSVPIRHFTSRRVGAAEAERVRIVRDPSRLVDVRAHERYLSAEKKKLQNFW